MLWVMDTPWEQFPVLASRKVSWVRRTERGTSFLESSRGQPMGIFDNMNLSLLFS